MSDFRAVVSRLIRREMIPLRLSLFLKHTGEWRTKREAPLRCLHEPDIRGPQYGECRTKKKLPRA